MALASSIGPNDVAARLGGDEFGAFSRGSQSERNARVARLRGRVDNVPVPLPEGVLHVNASIGEAEHIWAVIL